MPKYEFRERLPHKIEAEEILHHTSSRGCPVDIALQNSYLTCGVTVIPPGERLGRMAAHGGDEVYYVLEGTCIVECARHQTDFMLTQGDWFHIPAGQIHAPRNDSATHVKILWFCAPSWP